MDASRLIRTEYDQAIYRALNGLTTYTDGS